MIDKLLERLVEMPVNQKEYTGYEGYFTIQLPLDVWCELKSKYTLHELYSAFKAAGITTIQIRKSYGWKVIKLWKQ